MATTMEDVGVEREAGASATRRVAMRRLSLAAMAIVGGVAKLTASADPAWAYTYYCCTLAKPHSPGCMYNCWRYAGYAAYSWTCWYGSTQYWCGECTTGTSCWNGTFLCSEYGQM